MNRGGITMSARVVESFRGPWSPLGGALHDPDVARDFVGHLEPTHGPTVVRVSGGPPWLRGDWLCDTGERLGLNSPVRPFEWSVDSRGRRYWRGKQLIDAWERCDDPLWLARLVANHGKRLRRNLVAAALDCARAVAGGSPELEAVIAAGEASRPGDARFINEPWRVAASPHAGPAAARNPARNAALAAGGDDGFVAITAESSIADSVAASLYGAAPLARLTAAVRARVKTIDVLRMAEERQRGER